jgi:hypothetical protein
MFIVAWIYATHQPQLSGQQPTAAAAYAKVYLAFLHRYPGSFLSQMIFFGADDLLLIGVAVGAYGYLEVRGARLARLSLFFGVASALVQSATTIYSGVSLSSMADKYSAAAGQARDQIISDLIHPSVLSLIGESIAPTLFGGVVWLGLVGMSLIQLQGTRSVFGWITIAVAILTMFPILPFTVLWCVGTSYVLFKAQRSDQDAVSTASSNEHSARVTDSANETKPRPPRAPPDLRLDTVAPPKASVEAMTPARPPRGTSERRAQPAPARGSKSGRHRKRR